MLLTCYFIAYVLLLYPGFPLTEKRRLTTSDNLFVSIQEKIKWADSMGEVDKKHKKDVEERVEEAKKSLSIKVRSWVLSCFTVAFFCNYLLHFLS